MTASLPPFPTDDATLLAVRHALGASHSFDAEGAPVVVGADYSLSQLLDFIGDTMGSSPEEQVLDFGAVPIVYDPRPHYSEHSVITALIDEVDRLRAAAGSA